MCMSNGEARDMELWECEPFTYMYTSLPKLTLYTISVALGFHCSNLETEVLLKCLLERKEYACNLACEHSVELPMIQDEQSEFSPD